MNKINKIIIGVNLPYDDCMSYSVEKDGVNAIEEKTKTLPDGKQVLMYTVFKNGKLYAEFFWNNQIGLFYQ